MVGPDDLRKSDNHTNLNGFRHEREAFLKWRAESGLDQQHFYVVCGDRHWQYVSHFEDTNLWEFGCGAGADRHAGGWSQDNVKPEHRFLRVKGGYLFGSLSYENEVAHLTFQHRDVDGNVVHEESFSR